MILITCDPSTAAAASAALAQRHAGEFADWLEAMQAVLRGEQAADVPCGGCVGCCVSSYPVPLRPSDEAALRRVPDRFLQWPGPDGSVRMMFREDGSCPMLSAGSCTIYADRPQTCRDYDCRIYAAAGVEPDGQRPVIQERVRQWQFSFARASSRARADAVKRAAAFIRANAAGFPKAARAHSATAMAVLAVKVHPLFLGTEGVPAGPSGISQVMDAVRAFDAGTA